MELDRRLLVVTYHYPPDESIGGLRWAGLAKYLTPLGWRTWIVTAAGPGAAPVAGVSVESCPRRRTWNDRYQEARRAAARAGAGCGDRPGGLGADGSRGTRGVLARVRLEASWALSVPDHGRGWVLRAAAHAGRLLRRVRPHVVVSSGPPHSAHIAAWLATRGCHIPWLADLRDPWAGPVTGAWREDPVYRSWLASGLTRSLERLVVRGASGVVATTQEFAAALRKRYPAVRVHWIPNGVDRDALSGSSTDPFPGLGMVCAGTIYGGRNPSPVLRGLRLFLERHPDAATCGTKLRIAGHIDASGLRRLNDEAASLGLGAYVEYCGVLPRAAALRLVGRSRVAFVLAQEQDLQVPAKLYETVALGVRTIVVAAEGSAAASEARRLGACAIEPGDIAGMARLLDDAWREPHSAGSSGRRSADYAVVARAAAQVLVEHAAGGA